MTNELFRVIDSLDGVFDILSRDSDLDSEEDIKTLIEFRESSQQIVRKCRLLISIIESCVESALDEVPSFSPNVSLSDNDDVLTCQFKNFLQLVCFRLNIKDAKIIVKVLRSIPMLILLAEINDNNKVAGRSKRGRPFGSLKKSRESELNVSSIVADELFLNIEPVLVPNSEISSIEDTLINAKKLLSNNLRKFSQYLDELLSDRDLSQINHRCSLIEFRNKVVYPSLEALSIMTTLKSPAWSFPRQLKHRNSKKGLNKLYTSQIFKLSTLAMNLFLTVESDENMKTITVDKHGDFKLSSKTTTDSNELRINKKSNHDSSLVTSYTILTTQIESGVQNWETWKSRDGDDLCLSDENSNIMRRCLYSMILSLNDRMLLVFTNTVGELFVSNIKLIFPDSYVLRFQKKGFDDEEICLNDLRYHCFENGLSNHIVNGDTAAKRQHEFVEDMNYSLAQISETWTFHGLSEYTHRNANAPDIMADDGRDTVQCFGDSVKWETETSFGQYIFCTNEIMKVGIESTRIVDFEGDGSDNLDHFIITKSFDHKDDSHYYSIINTVQMFIFGCLVDDVFDTPPRGDGDRLNSKDTRFRMALFRDAMCKEKERVLRIVNSAL